jgi:hypothetical protein
MTSAYFPAAYPADSNLLFLAATLGQLYRGIDGGDKWIALQWSAGSHQEGVVTEGGNVRVRQFRQYAEETMLWVGWHVVQWWSLNNEGNAKSPHCDIFTISGNGNG